jgi:hypothetical protein
VDPESTPFAENFMGKLRLHLDDLAVETFDTERARMERGTVVGREYTEDGNYTCPGYATCAGFTCAACSFTCPVSCNGTCTLCTEGWTCYGCPPE